MITFLLFVVFKCSDESDSSYTESRKTPESECSDNSDFRCGGSPGTWRETHRRIEVKKKGNHSLFGNEEQTKIGAEETSTGLQKRFGVLNEDKNRKKFSLFGNEELAKFGARITEETSTGLQKRFGVLNEEKNRKKFSIFGNKEQTKFSARETEETSTGLEKRFGVLNEDKNKKNF
jgi:hypothetical protein